MPTSKCVIGSVIAVAVVVAAGVGIYFAVSGGESKSTNNDKPTPKDPNDSSTDKLLVKSIDGSIKVFDRKSKSFTDNKIESTSYGITAFGPYLDQTIYYATTEAGSVIHSTNTKEFPDLPEFTADWIKTAIAVDDVTKNVYLVDRVAGQINVVQGKYQHDLSFELLEEPKDVILAPESGKMFVLEDTKIIMANMDGTDEEVIIGSSNLKAFTADTIDGVLYFANDKGISSYDYSKSKKVTVVNEKEKEVTSLAYKNKVLYFINKKGKSSSSPGTSLDNCRLDESKSEGKCLNVFSVHKNEALEQLKVYRSDKPQTKNPCETDNGGCQHLCLLSSNKEKHSCACDKGSELQEDGKTCKSDPNDSSTDKLLIKSTDGLIKVFDRKSKSFTDTKVESTSYGITAFGPHLDQTVYYATTEPESVIYSTNTQAFPNLPEFTADWVKTAIAVDDVTKNVYVVDRLAAEINVIVEDYQHALPLTLLEEPKDVFLEVKSGKMFVLDKTKIIMADMDGTDEEEIVKADNIQAMAVDAANQIIYFAHPKGISSFNLQTENEVVINDKQTTVTSLAYKDKVLYFINKKGKTSSSPGTSLDNCRLDDDGECHEVFSVFKSEQLEQLKIYNSEKPQIQNPCETDNGGCQHLCLLNSGEQRFSCACDKGLELLPDGKTCKSDPNDSSTDKLLIKSTDGLIKVFDRKSKSFTDTKVESTSYGIIAFGPHLDQTVYYATTEPESVIYSTNTEEFPNLPEFTADWVKTAIAVDDVTKNVYVVDRVAPQINVIVENYQHAFKLKLLEEPKDVILAPESGKMFVLDKSKIIMASMDGTGEEVIVTADNIQAMTLDAANQIIYFAHPKGISSFNLQTENEVVINDKQTTVSSLAYKDKVLYFINKKGKTSSSPGTSLDNCRLDDSECHEVFSVLKSEQLEQLKIYNSEKPQIQNPCETDNGGCEHLCLLNSGEQRFSCACDKGWVLQEDEKTCKNES